MSGVVFRNEKKTKDTQPGYTGQCMIDGKEYFMDAWVKEGRSGKFFSFSFKQKLPNQYAQQQSSKPARSMHDEMGESDVPF
jgi:hypothetical protein